MILNPGVIALLTAALVITGMVLLSSGTALRILRCWDPASGSELQLELERRTYLISTVLGYALLFQAFSLLLLIFVADQLHTQINGAMCAVGTFNANAYGYPALLLKIINVLLAGTWLILNSADNRGHDYPLIRVKYRLLLVLVLPLMVEAWLLWSFFLNIQGDVITSCCGSLFSSGGKGVSADLAALPAIPVLVVFYGLMGLVFLLGVRLLRGRGRGLLFGLVAALIFPVTLAAIISYFGPLFYELPHHHCPFCLLLAEYHYLGYLLYPLLFGGTLAGIGCAVLARFHSVSSLALALPGMQRTLAVLCLSGFGGFLLVVAVRILTTEFSMFS